MAGQEPRRTSELTESTTAAPVESLADKLEWWAESLPERERELLVELLARAARAGGDEVHGYGAGQNVRPISHLVRLVLAGGGDDSAPSVDGVPM
jgi:hypothetical protein